DLALAHGLHQTGQWTARVAGTDAMVVLTGAMAALRAAPPATVAGRAVVAVADLIHGDPARGLGPNDVITLHLEGARVVVRPSGTEPKLKCYVEVVEAVADRADLAPARRRALDAVDAIIADLAATIPL